MDVNYEISNRKRKSAASLKCITNKKGEKLNKPINIANCLNEHFSSVGKNMASEIENVVDPKSMKNPLDYLPRTVKNSLFFCDIDFAEILNLIAKLVTKKACGYDHISNRILKKTSYIIAPYLCILFNNCIRQGVFPDAYKIAKVIPLFKKGGDKESKDSYRPISLLPALGKLLEKLISVRVVRFFEAYDLFSPHQFGFRAKFSTDYAIVDIYEKLLSNLDKGLSTCAVFLDLAKAFDSVSHDILLQKLKRYGIRGNTFDFFSLIYLLELNLLKLTMLNLH